ncbi:MAG: hypothetical protein Ct9H300mP20_16870 [Gammaproteobacteria bacterium]|nr:MAG: hypothetical protein Ct9H300mP20_16870 [Gammaproteobacteria bacterium]
MSKRFLFCTTYSHRAWRIFPDQRQNECERGKGEGGASAEAPAYGYEPCNAQHDQTIFLEDSEFYMTFLGPLNFIDEEGNTVALFTWQDVQGAWEAS